MTQRIKDGWLVDGRDNDGDADAECGALQFSLSLEVLLTIDNVNQIKILKLASAIVPGFSISHAVHYCRASK